MNILAEDKSEVVELDDNKKYYEDLVGEGKKFKDQEALARSKYEADSYIEILKRQKDELRTDFIKAREELMAKANLEELIKKIDSKQSRDDEPKHEDKVKPVELPDLDKIFTEKMNAYEISKRQEANQKAVKDKLIERYGRNYQNTVKQQIEDLGISEEVFNQMAQNYPSMVFKTLDLDKPLKTESFQAPPRNSIQGPPGKGKTDRTWSYYQELKKANPKLYYDPKITNQMHEDYRRLGDAFEDGDFNA